MGGKEYAANWEASHCIRPFITACAVRTISSDTAELLGYHLFAEKQVAADHVLAVILGGFFVVVKS